MVACIIFGSFLYLIAFCYMTMTVYPFPCLWTFGLIQVLEYYEQSCCKHSGTSLLVEMSLHFSRVNSNGIGFKIPNIFPQVVVALYMLTAMRSLDQSPCQLLVWSAFTIWNILMGVKLYLIVIFVFLATLSGLWDLSFLTRGGTWPLQWKHQILTTGAPGNSPSF